MGTYLPGDGKKINSFVMFKGMRKASKDIGLEVNCEKVKYIMISRHQNVVQNQNIVIGNLSFENVEKLKYVGVPVINTNEIREEIKRGINTRNACYFSLDKILSSRLGGYDIAIIYHSNHIHPSKEADGLWHVIATGSEVPGFKAGRGPWTFSERKSLEYDFLRKGCETVGAVS